MNEFRSILVMGFRLKKKERECPSGSSVCRLSAWGPPSLLTSRRPIMTTIPASSHCIITHGDADTHDDDDNIGGFDLIIMMIMMMRACGGRRESHKPPQKRSPPSLGRPPFLLFSLWPEASSFLSASNYVPVPLEWFFLSFAHLNNNHNHHPHQHHLN